MQYLRNRCRANILEDISQKHQCTSAISIIHPYKQKPQLEYSVENCISQIFAQRAGTKANRSLF